MSTTEIHLSIFDGKLEHWIPWKLKFETRWHMLGYGDQLNSTFTLPGASDAGYAAAVKLQTKGYCEFLYALKSTEDIILISQSRQSGTSNGNLTEAWDHLVSRYQPKDALSRVDLMCKLDQLKLSDYETSDEWFNESNRLRNQLKDDFNKIYDDEYILYILYKNLPDGVSYENIKVNYMRQMTSTVDKLTLNGFRDQLRLFMRNMNKVETPDQELITNSKCGNCGKFGHSREECKGTNKSAEASNKKNLVECDLCGKKVHKAARCWSKLTCSKCNKKGHPTRFCRASKDDNTQETQKELVMCNYCGFCGHSAEECKINKRDEEKQRTTVQSQDVPDISNITLMVADPLIEAPLKTLWVADTGVTANMCNSSNGVHDYTPLDMQESVKVGDGRELAVIGIGNFIGMFKDKIGNISRLTLSGVKVIPQLSNNLISITKVLSSGGVISNEGRHLMLKIDGNSIKFGAEVMAGDGYLNGIHLQASLESKLSSNYSLVAHQNININHYHQLLGHPCERYTRLTAAKNNITLTGSFNTCISCSLGKINKKNINKENNHKTNLVGERLYFDLRYINSTSLGGNKYWLLVEDEATGYNLSIFLPIKSELASKLCNIIKQLLSQNINIKYLRCDNAGENLMVQNELVNVGIKNIKMEHTAPRTPEQNGVVERKFATLYNKVRCMFNHAGIYSHLRKALWA